MEVWVKMIHVKKNLAYVIVILLACFALLPSSSCAFEIQEVDDEVYLKSDLYDITFSRAGGGIKSYILNQKRYNLDLVRNPVKPGLLCLSLMSADQPGQQGLVEALLPEQSGYSVETSYDTNEASLTFSYVIQQHFLKGKDGSLKLGGTPQSVEVRKTYRFHQGKYLFDFSITFICPDEQDKAQGAFVFGWFPGLGSQQPIDDKPGVLEEGKFDDKKPGKEGELVISGPPSSLIGIKDSYFAAVFEPLEPLQQMQLALWRAPAAKRDILAGVRLPDFEISSGEEVSFVFKTFIGPKEVERLTGILHCLRPTGRIVPHILRALKLCHRWTNNWGLSIILLTVMIKIILLPLTIKQAQNMAKMQTIQPEMNAIRSKYKSDPQRMNQETIRLYKEKKVNPLGGCLPAFVQIPILFALFWALRNCIELKGSGFLWILDLSLPDRSFTLFGQLIKIPLLPVVTAATAWLQQKQMNTNPQQAKMMAFFPVMMFVFSYSLPSGVVLYWFISNLLQVGQQYVINTRINPTPEVKTEAQDASVVSKQEEKSSATSEEEAASETPGNGAALSENTPPLKKKRRRRKKKKS